MAGIDVRYAKYLKQFAAAVILAALICVATTQKAMTLCGDVTGDSQVLSDDILMAARASVGDITLTSLQRSRADVVLSGAPDGLVLSNDVLMIARSAAGAATLICNDGCASHDYKACYDGNPYWYDACGTRETIAETCTGGTVCVDGECVCNPACSSDAACDDSNPLTADVCLNPGTCAASCSHIGATPSLSTTSLHLWFGSAQSSLSCAPTPDTTLTEGRCSTGGAWTQMASGTPLICTYTTAGTFAPACRADSSVINETSITILPEPNHPPTVSINSDKSSGKSPLTIAFTSTCSDYDGTCAAITWDFGDLSPFGATPDISHTYTAQGVYTVTHTATDNTGATTTATMSITVAPPNQPPLVSFTPDTLTGRQPLTVNFTGTCADPDGTCDSYSWTFCDTTPADTTLDTTLDTTHIFPSQGICTVTLTAIDNDGASSLPATATITILPPNTPPVITIAADTVAGQPPVTVNFTATCTDDVSCASFGWNFGDGSATESTTLTPSHSYTAAGAYNVTFEAIDNENAISSKTIQIYTSPSWSTIVPGASQEFGLTLIQPDDNTYIAGGRTLEPGGTFYDALFARFDTSGNLITSKTQGVTAGSDSFTSGVTGNAGSIVFAGSTGEPGAPQLPNYWTVKTDTSGNISLQSNIGIPDATDNLYSIKASPTGGYVAVGHGITHILNNRMVFIRYDENLNPTPNYFTAYDNSYGQAIWPTADGGAVIAGGIMQNLDDGYDLSLIKYSQTGALSWIRPVYNSGVHDKPQDMIQLPDGGYIIPSLSCADECLITNSTITRTDSAGNLIWVKSFTGAGIDSLNSITRAVDGNYIAAGTTSSKGAGGKDIWIVKIDPDGNTLADLTFGGAGDDEAFSIITTNDYGYLITGSSNSFSASHDLWLLKLNPALQCNGTGCN